MARRERNESRLRVVRRDGGYAVEEAGFLVWSPDRAWTLRMAAEFRKRHRVSTHELRRALRDPEALDA